MPEKSIFLDIISKKWYCHIILTLGIKPYRFNELHRGIPKISQRVLTKALRDLEVDGLITRQVFPTKPPSVEYSLTPMGVSLLAPLRELTNWAYEYHHLIRNSRERSTDCMAQ